jgi:hypothetical protein
LADVNQQKRCQQRHFRRSLVFKGEIDLEENCLPQFAIFEGRNTAKCKRFKFSYLEHKHAARQTREPFSASSLLFRAVRKWELICLRLGSVLKTGPRGPVDSPAQGRAATDPSAMPTRIDGPVQQKPLLH